MSQAQIWLARKIAYEIDALQGPLFVLMFVLRYFWSPKSSRLSGIKPLTAQCGPHPLLWCRSQSSQRQPIVLKANIKTRLICRSHSVSLRRYFFHHHLFFSFHRSKPKSRNRDLIACKEPETFPPGFLFLEKICFCLIFGFCVCCECRVYPLDPKKSRGEIFTSDVEKKNRKENVFFFLFF